MKIDKLFIYLIINILIIVPFISFSQTIDNDSYLDLTFLPNNPEPFSEIKINLKSYIYDLNRSKITWFINGIEKKSGIGQTDFDLKLGPNNEKSSIRVMADIPNKGLKTTSITIIPSTVDLIYESLSYTPPFYKGKSLYTSKNTTLITAIPDLRKSDGTKIPDKNIIYTWKKDGQKQNSASGYGKNTFLFDNPFPFRDFNIEVEASSFDGNIKAIGKLKIYNDKNQIIFYENNPIYGLMTNKALNKDLFLSTNEISISAIPFFFSVSEAKSIDLNYLWSINGSRIENQEFKDTLTTRIEKAGFGTANINLKIENLKNTLQNTEQNLLLKYNLN